MKIKLNPEVFQEDNIPYYSTVYAWDKADKFHGHFDQSHG